MMRKSFNLYIYMQEFVDAFNLLSHQWSLLGNKIRERRQVTWKQCWLWSFGYKLPASDPIIHRGKLLYNFEACTLTVLVLSSYKVGSKTCLYVQYVLHFYLIGTQQLIICEQNSKKPMHPTYSEHSKFLEWHQLLQNLCLVLQSKGENLFNN